jgi:hypothetical protein
MWTSTDAVKFREYLFKSNGQLLHHLTETAPTFSVTEESKVEAVALQGAFKEGFLHAVKLLGGLANVAPKQDDATSGGFTAM